MPSLDDVLIEVSKDGRVCPKPQKWVSLWEMLPGRRPKGHGWEPPSPLILAAWGHTSDMEKRERFHDHIRWAYQFGALDSVADFILNLNPEDWHRED
jgi:hypothetical protein